MPVDVIIDPSSGQIYWNDAAGSGTQTIAISGNATNAINIVGYSNFFSPGGGGLGTQILATFTDSATSTFTPGTNAYDLGSSSLRWNFYGTGGNFTGAISTSSTTASTSSTTGALVVTGGAGIAKTSYFGQDVKILGSTASTNPTTGALVVNGGVGISGRLSVGLAVTQTVDGGGGAEVIATFASSASFTGAAVVIHTTNSFGTPVLVFKDYSGKEAYIKYWDDSAGITPNYLEITSPGALYYLAGNSGSGYTGFHNFGGSGVTFYHDTASTSSTTGGLTVSGGAGIAKTSYFGQSVVIQGTTAAGSTTTGALVVTGGVGIGGSLNVFGTIDVANNIKVLSQKEVRFFNSANTFYTGLRAGSPSANVTFTLPVADGSANQVLYTNGSAALGWTTVASVSAITSLNGLTAATQTFATGTSGTDFNISSSTSTHTFNIPYAGSGATGLITTQAQTIAGSKTFSSQTIISDTTVSSSTATGALLVYGGLGVTGQINAASLQTSGNAVISGNLTFNGVGVFGNATSDTINSLARYISDILPSTDNSYDLGNNSLGWRNFRVSGVGTIASLAVTSSTVSTSSTTGALRVSGGAGIALTSYFGQDVKILGSTASTSSYTGSLTVAGGVGISGGLYIGVDAPNVFGSEAIGIGGSNAQITLKNTYNGPDSKATQILFMNNGDFLGSIGIGQTYDTSPNQLTINNEYDINYYAYGTNSIHKFTSPLDIELTIGGTGVSVLNTTASNSTTTGALTVSGGAGIAKTSYFGQDVKILGTTASTNTTTGALTVSGGVGIGGSLWTSTSNLASISGVGFQNSAITSGVWAGIAISAVNGGTGQVSYTVGDLLYASSTTALSKLSAGTAGSVLKSNGAGTAPSWQVDSTGSGGAGTVASGTANQVAYYASTGASVSGAANLTYNTTSVIVANTTASNNNSSGALLVYGGIGASGQISGAGASFTSTVFLNGIQIGQGGNNINILDSSGATIANFNTSNGWFRSAQTTQSTSSATGSLVSLGGLGVAKAASIGETIYGYSTVASTGWSTGSLILSGGLGVSKTSYINGDLFITSSTASTNTTSGALVVTGSVGIGGTLNVGTAITAFDPVGSIANFARNAPTGSAIVSIQNTSSNAVSMATLQFRDHLGAQAYIRFSNSVTFGSSVPNVLEITNQVSQIVYTVGSGSSSNHTFTGGSGVSIQQTNASTSSTTGALVVTGGVGVGGSLWTSTSNFSSVSGVGISNSVITSGVWSGTAISAVKGGTGQVSYAIGDILYASSTTALAKLSAGTAGSVLASGGTGAAPYWKVDATGGGGGTPAGSSSWLQYNNGGAFGATSHLAYNGNLNNDFVISAPYSGAIQGQINIGMGVTAFDGTTLGRFAGSASGTIIAANYASGFTGNFADFQLAGSSKFTIGFDGKITVVGVYSLPTTAGTAGSVLTSNGTGNQFYWSAPGAAGGGSGTVTSGTAGSVAYYTGTGTTVGGAPGFTYTTSGTASTMNVFGGGAIGTTIFTVQAYSSTSVRVGIGTNLPQFELDIRGEISATNKSFVIDHPTKPGKKLRYGSLEGPENGVYVRGELKDLNIIETPDHWVGLVHPDSFTVTLTPIGRFSYLYVEKIEDYKVFIADAYMNPIHCYYTVWAERKDIPKLVTEY